MTNTTDLNEAITLLVDKGGYEPEELTALPMWLERGDDVLVFSNHDLSSLAARPLYLAMPWERDEPTPKQAPDTDVAGLGWRYLPEMRVTVEPAEVTS
jgi:hypothetical protein